MTLVFSIVFTRWQHQQNLIASEFGQVQPSLKISTESACNILYSPSERKIT